MIKENIKKIGFRANGKKAKKVNMETDYYILICDDCGSTFERPSILRDKRFNKWGKDMCEKCSNLFHKKRIADVGRKSLGSRTKDQMIEHAKIGGLACQK